MDWAGVGMFRNSNAELRASGHPVEVVFMGDSLTQFWSDLDPTFFRPNWVNRGISGQTTPQMLIRFRPDVVNLAPRAVHILAGSNDIYGNTGPTSCVEILGNIMSMVELAQIHDIAVVLATPPPSNGKMIELKDHISAYARDAALILADYHSALDNGEGCLSAQDSPDHLHLTGRGYDTLSEIAATAIAAALTR